MKSIEKITEHTLVIKKSEFICTLIPLNDEEKINETIDYYKEKYKETYNEKIQLMEERWATDMNL